MVDELENDRDAARLSWLLLERYALGEAHLNEVAFVEARLSVSAEDRKRLAEIKADPSMLGSLTTRLR